MAEASRCLLLLLFSSLLLSISVAPSLAARHHHHPSRSHAGTATLDVSASLFRAHLAVSFDPASRRQGTLDQEALSASKDPTTLSLRLHSRDFLPPFAGAASGAHRRHPDYKSLTLARLRRDEARVRSITARLSLALSGMTTLDLEPLAADDNAAAAALAASEATESIHGPVVSGTSQGSGEYFSRVGVGSPAKPMYMVLDTGSDVTWLQCQPCADCYQQSDPVFDPAASSSYAPLPCDAQPCHSLDVSACRNASGSCLYQVSYGDGSYTVGDFATESLTLGASSPVQGVALGCGHDNEGLFVGAAGLLALGGGPLSFPSQIAARSFSYCLVDRDSPSSSTLDLGTANSSYDASDVAVTAPLLRNGKMSTFYYVSMTGISVGGEMLTIPPTSFAVDDGGSGGVIVDSGTAVTRLQTGAYTALRDAFKRGTSSLPSASGVSLFDTCYDLSSRTSVEVPTVALHFPGGKELRLPAKNYLIPVDGEGTYCLAFAATSAPLSIIGNVQQQGTRVTYDLHNAVVGFTPNKC